MTINSGFFLIISGIISHAKLRSLDLPFLRRKCIMKSKNKYSFFYFKYKNAKVVYVPLAHMSVSIFSDNRSFQLANSLYAV